MASVLRRGSGLCLQLGFQVSHSGIRVFLDLALIRKQGIILAADRPIPPRSLAGRYCSGQSVLINVDGLYFACYRGKYPWMKEALGLH